MTDACNEDEGQTGFQRLVFASSCIYFVFSAAMCVVLVLLIRQRANWVAIFIAACYSVGCVLKGYTTSSFYNIPNYDDEQMVSSSCAPTHTYSQIGYIDCNGQQ